MWFNILLALKKNNPAHAEAMKNKLKQMNEDPKVQIMAFYGYTHSPATRPCPDQPRSIHSECSCSPCTMTDRQKWSISSIRGWKEVIHACDAHPDANSQVEKKVGGDDDDIGEAEGLTEVVEVGGGVGHSQSLRQYTRTQKCEGTHKIHLMDTWTARVNLFS